MKIYVTAKTKSKKKYVEKIDENHFIVAVRAMPSEGKANDAIIKSLAGYFKIPLSSIWITSGQKSKYKIIEINIQLL